MDSRPSLCFITYHAISTRGRVGCRYYPGDFNIGAHGERSQDSSVSIVTRLWTGNPTYCRFSAAERDFSVLKKVQTGPGTNSACHSMGFTRLFLWE